MEWLFSPQAWIGLLTLTALEIVLGIDNVIFISIVAGRLPGAKQDRARRTGLALAAITRILLLLSLTWIMGLTAPLSSFAARRKKALMSRVAAKPMPRTSGSFAV